MNTLFARLAAALLVIVVGISGAFHVVEQVNTKRYYEELAQTLNAPIAMYVTAQHQLIRDGVPDLDALDELAGRAMLVNPAAEIYLLDPSGTIIGSGVDAATLKRDRVALAPLRALIDGSASLPVRGVDPRDPTTRKIFSAAEVRSADGGLEGYLYVVLAGRTYEALAANLRDSYAGRSSLVALVAIAAVAVALGLLTFGLLTRRLERLRGGMRRAVESGFTDLPAVPSRPVRDEIDALEQVFADMARRIADQVAQLRDTDRLRRELVTNISHDLRTPLAAMRGYIETMRLQAGALDADTREQYLDIINKHALRLGRLVDDLFELSKLEAAAVTPSLEAFSLPELVQDVAQEFRLAADDKGVELAIDVNTRSGRTVGDIGLIQRVLENLVRNALQHTPSGGRIVLSVTERRQRLAVAVTDTGEGIAAADLPRIFDRFYRADDASQQPKDSSGIGLAIVKRILDLHGSRIVVQSRVDAGTQFEFELPGAAARAA